MDETDYYLQGGKFTGINSVVLDVLQQIREIPERETLPGKISFYLSNIMRKHEPRNMEEFRRRTASQIIDSGYYNSCSDSGLVFLALARAGGIPAKYIETLEEKNLIEKSRELVSGHVFAEIFLNGRWQKYEPHRGFESNGIYHLGDSKYVKIGEGLDFSELRLENGNIINLDTVDKIRKLRNNYHDAKL